MASFTAQWLEIADDHYADLPPEAQHHIDVRVAELCDQPDDPPGAYDPHSDQWTTFYGDGAGLIVYAIAPPSAACSSSGSSDHARSEVTQPAPRPRPGE